ncbi:MAG: cytochrome c maturation protein CcmE [Candidatus Hydrothermarchaeaceae archaeon]
MDEMKARRVKVLLGVVVIGLSILIGVDAMEDFLNPLKYVREVTSEPGKYVGRNVQVVGWIVDGSWRTGEKPGHYFFELSDGEATIKVDYTGDPPGTLKQGVGVTVIGVMTSEDTLTSNKLLIKCPSKYEQTLREAYEEQTQKDV